ncbi:MAG: proline--tRNA ligase [Acholeplasmatales bacterium]|nr:proline--tRNA ligase [Acholeplasmatales bacterium]
MKASRMLIATLKEVPNDAVIPSHILLIRSGMIKKMSAGIYNYLPLGLRTLRKVENIIREEMDKAGAEEILCSCLQPKELWEASGRWYKYGSELMRIKDRHDRDFCLAPTAEEVFTDLTSVLVKSYKQLPVIPYQIQTKYRDEFRPRFGLMRSREFIMKDAYSFDVDTEGLDKSYDLMYKTYEKIFDRFHLNYKIVLADSGAIGGNGSHQFMALSSTGESDIIYCDCGYAADAEKAESKAEVAEKEEMLSLEEVHTPNFKTIEEVANFLNIDVKKTVKAVAYRDLEHNKTVICFVRGDRDVNEIKVINELGVSEELIRMATPEEIAEIGTVDGFMGPIGLKEENVLIDIEVTNMYNFVVGANKKDYHIKNANFNRDFKGKILDLRLAKESDLCPICGKPMKLERGIEVGQVFKLQTKYSEAMGCTYLDKNGQTVPMVMGCYGIGVTRTMSAIIEQYHDEFGIKWPLNVAPYHVVIVPAKYTDPAQQELADKIHDMLNDTKVEVILDDRDASLGFKMKDFELIGIPYIMIVGRRAAEGIVELKDRMTNEKVEMPYEEAIKKIVEAVENI